jgi:outer membrane protein OmpA-like peptidoglycan-associated protein
MRFPLTLALLLLAAPARPDGLWANLVPLPAGVQPTEGTLVSHAFDEGSFLLGTTDQTKRGRYVSGYLTRLPEGFHEPSEAAWKKWEPVLRARGFVLKGHRDDVYTLQRVEGPAETWLTLGLAEYQDPKLTVVQLPAAPRTLDLVPPSATPEKVSGAQEWPFLRAPAGSKLEDTSSVPEPLSVTVEGLDQEPHLVGRSYALKRYTPPASLSKIEFELSYREALKRAGWTVLPNGGMAEGEGLVRAHYSANGRDIWAVLGRAADDSNTGMSISVADVGAEDWAKALASQCRLPLYGVTFDFDKATLRPESAPVLEKAAAALTGNPALSIEVQGHTDDVGEDAYNLKLSGQRAETVRLWLTQHGVAATRLTARGYGKTQPVIENSSDANRARNRRVELACRK